MDHVLGATGLGDGAEDRFELPALRDVGLEPGDIRMFIDAGAALRAARDPEETIVVSQLFEDVAAHEARGTGHDNGWQGHA
jgi:hypothetical protein